MINKQNMWFLTLFSLVLVLSVYYITMPNELQLASDTKKDNNSTETTKQDEDNSSNVDVDMSEASTIETMKVEDDTSVQETIKELEQTLTSMNISVKDKNKAYEELQSINKNSAKEEALESTIKDKYNKEVFVKIKGNQIRVGNTEGTTELANEIMRLVQEQFDKKMYISVQFSS